MPERLCERTALHPGELAELVERLGFLGEALDEATFAEKNRAAEIEASTDFA